MAELGADLIKCFFTGERFHEVVEFAMLASPVDPFDPMDTAFEKLTKASHRLAEEIYRGATAAGAQAGSGDSAGSTNPPQAGAPSADGDVVDAEYVDVETKPTN